MLIKVENAQTRLPFFHPDLVCRIPFGARSRINEPKACLIPKIDGVQIVRATVMRWRGHDGHFCFRR